MTVQRNWRITKASSRHCYCSMCISSSRMNTRAPSGLAPCHPGGSALSQCGCTEALGVQSPLQSCRNSPPHFLLSLSLSAPGSLGVWRLALFLNSFPPGHRPTQVLSCPEWEPKQAHLVLLLAHDWGGTRQSSCVNNGSVGLPCKQVAPPLAGFCAASSPRSLEGRGPLFLKPLPSAPLSTHVTGLQASIVLRKSAVVRGSLEPRRGHVPCRDLALSRVVSKEVVEGCSGSPFRASRSHTGLASQF